MKDFKTLSLKYENNQFLVLDQTLLPHEEKWILIDHPEKAVFAIKTLKVRGAPLIGIVAGLSLADFVFKGASLEAFKTWSEKLLLSRPTAVNLSYVIQSLRNLEFNPLKIIELVYKMIEEDKKLCDQISKFGAAQMKENETVLTHCNTGSLATCGSGTALGIIKEAFKQNKIKEVLVSETRPLLQGARLSTWELEKNKIPYRLICDHMSAHLMSQFKISRLIVGADRIAKNGDTANKIGTFNHAICANYHKIPFWVAAPYTTLDLSCRSGKDIKIENRDELEVKKDWSPKEARAINPAFDVTPACLISAWVLDTGFYTQFKNLI